MEIKIMKLIFTVFLSIFLLVGSKSFATDYLCEKTLHLDGSYGDTIYMTINGQTVITKNKYVTIKWTEIPLGYEYKLYKMTSNTSEGLMVLAIQDDNKSILNLSHISGSIYRKRNSYSWGNCSQLR